MTRQSKETCFYLNRFINQLTASDSKPPEDWTPGAHNLTNQQDETDELEILEHVRDLYEEPQAETEEDKAAKRLATLVTLFPTADPDFLNQKGVEFGFEAGSEERLNRWIDGNIGKGSKDFPTRAEYEKRVKEAEIINKYQVTDNRYAK